MVIPRASFMETPGGMAKRTQSILMAGEQPSNGTATVRGARHQSSNIRIFQALGNYRKTSS